MEPQTDEKVDTGVNFQFGKERILTEKRLQEMFEENIREGFWDLVDVKSENPKVKELQEYGRGIEDKFAFIRKPVGLTPQQAELLISKIPPEDRDAGFDATILRLQRETKYLDELEDVGISTALVDGLENGKYGAYTIFLNPDNFFAKMLKKKHIGGSYAPFFDTVIIPEKPPSSEEMWLKLSTEGQLPKFVNSLDHELTHDKQWNKLQRTALLTINSLPTATYLALYPHLGFLKSLAAQDLLLAVSRIISKKIDNDSMLGEVHAYNSGASSPTYHEPELDEVGEIASHIINSYDLKGRDYVDALLAYENVHTLRIMGVDDEEIGNIVSGAQFDNKTRSYPKLDKRVMEEKDKWGIKNKYDFMTVRRALLSQHELELRYQRHLAEQIAARELQRETGKWFD